VTLVTSVCAPRGYPSSKERAGPIHLDDLVTAAGAGRIVQRFRVVACHCVLQATPVARLDRERKTMLQDAERRAATLEQAVHDTRGLHEPPVSVPAAVECYLENRRATLSTNIDEARRMLSLAVERIVLRCEGKRLVAQIMGNLAGMFALEPSLYDSGGAGRGIRELATWPPIPLVMTG
jgi:hypothetical protein